MKNKEINFNTKAKGIILIPGCDGYNYVTIQDCNTSSLLEELTNRFTLEEILSEYDDIVFIQQGIERLILKRDLDRKNKMALLKKD